MRGISHDAFNNNTKHNNNKSKENNNKKSNESNNKKSNENNKNKSNLGMVRGVPLAAVKAHSASWQVAFAQVALGISHFQKLC